MYQQHLIHLAKDERFHARLAAGEVRAERRNPACGDELALGFEVREGRLEGLRCEVRACAVVRASVTALGHAVEGETLVTARARVAEAAVYFGGREEWGADWGAPDLPALGEVRAYPMRVACARLPWEALGEALGTATSTLSTRNLRIGP